MIAACEWQAGRGARAVIAACERQPHRAYTAWPITMPVTATTILQKSDRKGGVQWQRYTNGSQKQAGQDSMVSTQQATRCASHTLPHLSTQQQRHTSLRPFCSGLAAMRMAASSSHQGLAVATHQWVVERGRP